MRTPASATKADLSPMHAVRNPQGLLVVDDNLPAEAYVTQLHSHGMLLFRGHPSLSREGLLHFMRSRFPDAAPRPAADTAGRGSLNDDVLAYLDGRLVSAMGSIKDKNKSSRSRSARCSDFVSERSTAEWVMDKPAGGWTPLAALYTSANVPVQI